MTIARRLSFIRETDGANRGKWVQFVQRNTGGVPGDPWCADFLSLVLSIGSYGHPPLKPTGSCSAMLFEAMKKDLVVPSPMLDDLYFFLNDEGHAHHCGIITGMDEDGKLIGIAGNTSSDGRSVDGTGVFEHAIPTKNVVFVRVLLPSPPAAPVTLDELNEAGE